MCRAVRSGPGESPRVQGGCESAQSTIILSISGRVPNNTVNTGLVCAGKEKMSFRERSMVAYRVLYRIPVSWVLSMFCQCVVPSGPQGLKLRLSRSFQGKNRKREGRLTVTVRKIPPGILTILWPGGVKTSDDPNDRVINCGPRPGQSCSSLLTRLTPDQTENRKRMNYKVIDPKQNVVRPQKT
jgi:hypothetical protein